MSKTTAIVEEKRKKTKPQRNIETGILKQKCEESVGHI